MEPERYGAFTLERKSLDMSSDLSSDLRSGVKALLSWHSTAPTRTPTSPTRQTRLYSLTSDRRYFLSRILARKSRVSDVGLRMYGPTRVGRSRCPCPCLCRRRCRGMRALRNRNGCVRPSGGRAKSFIFVTLLRQRCYRVRALPLMLGPALKFRYSRISIEQNL